MSIINKRFWGRRLAAPFFLFNFAAKILMNDYSRHNQAQLMELIDEIGFLFGREACQCDRTPEASFQRIVAHLSQFLPAGAEKDIVRIVK